MNQNAETDADREESRSQSTADDLAESVFKVMSGKYGARFADAWRCVDMKIVKREWNRDLRKLSQVQIVRGLRLLEECKFPPTLPEFMALCKRPVIAAHVLALPSPPATKEQRAKGLETLANWKSSRGKEMVCEQ